MAGSNRENSANIHDGAPDSAAIEITPEMIAVGADVIWRLFGDVLSYGSETGRDVAIEVFRAMESVQGIEKSNEPAPRTTTG